MSYYDYAKLGSTCCTNMNVLLSNAKFIPMDDPVYKMFYTETRQYPGPLPLEPAQSFDEPEDIKRFPKKQCCKK
jgi:hypothetical protein